MLGVSSQEIIRLPALPLDSDVIFISDFDGVDFATIAVDRSVKAAHMSFFGAAHLDVLIKKYGSASYSAGGGTSGIKLPVDPDYATLVNGDFTIDGYVYAPTAFNFNTIIAGVFANGANAAQSLWAFKITSDTLRFSVQGIGGSAQDYAIALHGMLGGQFYYVAVCRCGPVIRIFVEGVMIAKAIFPVRSLLPNPTTIGLSIGCDWDLTNPYIIPDNINAMHITKKT